MYFKNKESAMDIHIVSYLMMCKYNYSIEDDYIIPYWCYLDRFRLFFLFERNQRDDHWNSMHMIRANIMSMIVLWNESDMLWPFYWGINRLLVYSWCTEVLLVLMKLPSQLWCRWETNREEILWWRIIIHYRWERVLFAYNEWDDW